MLDINNLLRIAIEAAIAAGKEILVHYHTTYNIEYKSDESPLTIADQSSHRCIESFLISTGIPLLSEEGKHTEYRIRKTWSHFWLIDPLDGTKEFIKKNNDFTVNIALIKDSLPIIGVIYVPVSGELYFASEDGSFKYTIETSLEPVTVDQIMMQAQKLPFSKIRTNYVVLGSKSHMNIETQEFINILQQKFPSLEFISRGSSIKFCALAEGIADIYPRFGPTMEWDTAAGQAIATYAGCSVVNAGTQYRLEYNKEELINPFFIAKRV